MSLETIIGQVTILLNSPGRTMAISRRDGAINIATRLKGVIMSWQRIYSHNAEGEGFGGNREALLGAARSGAPIKIGFPGGVDGDVFIAPADTVMTRGNKVYAGLSYFGFGAFFAGPMLVDPGMGNSRRWIDKVQEVYAISACTNGECFMRIIKGDSQYRSKFTQALVWYGDI